MAAARQQQVTGHAATFLAPPAAQRDALAKVMASWNQASRRAPLPASTAGHTGQQVRAIKPPSARCRRD